MSIDICAIVTALFRDVCHALINDDIPRSPPHMQGVSISCMSIHMCIFQQFTSPTASTSNGYFDEFPAHAFGGATVGGGNSIFSPCISRSALGCINVLSQNATYNKSIMSPETEK